MKRWKWYKTIQKCIQDIHWENASNPHYRKIFQGNSISHHTEKKFKVTVFSCNGLILIIAKRSAHANDISSARPLLFHVTNSKCFHKRHKLRWSSRTTHVKLGTREIWTRITGFRVLSANRYTMGPICLIVSNEQFSALEQNFQIICCNTHVELSFVKIFVRQAQNIL